MPTIAAASVTNRSVLAIAVPIMLSNATEPLIGVVNTAVIGRLPEAYYIGAITVGALVFNFIYWGFNFLRLGTGGLTAQAVGQGNRDELVAVLMRSLMIAAVTGIALVLLAPLIGRFAFSVIGGSAELRQHARTYFDIRIYSAPFALANYCLLGWFIGQSRARLAFAIQIVLNLVNMALCMLFVLGMGMTSNGVALGALFSEIVAALIGLALALRILSRMGARFDAATVFDRGKIVRTLTVNRDIMIRTVCLVFAFAWFTAQGAKAGDVIVSANAILFTFFNVAAYLIDGFAFASETLVGQAVGAADRPRFQKAIRLTSVWAGAVGILAFAIILIGGPYFIDWMAVNPEVRETARLYLFWAALAPLIGVACFQFDGIFAGATATADMRNMMVVSLALYMAAWWLLQPWGNTGLWISLNAFFLARGITFSTRLPSLERQAFPQAA
ncbi:MAG: MATE family efflux transporter [Hyphomicrobiales bacterium]